MSRTIIIVLAAGLLSAVAGADGADATAAGDRKTGHSGADDATKIQGRWACAAAVVNGKPLDKEATAKLRLVLTAQRYRTERGDEEVLFDSTYQLAPGSDPKQIQMIGTEGDAAGKPALGIYSLEGDTLKICYTLPGGERPKTFESKPGSNVFFATWTRTRK